MKSWQNIFLCLFLALTGGSCVEPYEPPVLLENHNYLVIEGFLDSGGGSSTLRLSRTTGLTEINLFQPETQATVSIESEKGTIYYLQEDFDGAYILEPLDLNFEDRYRLKVVTANGKEYLSDFVEVKKTPPIESVSWVLEDDGLQVFVNTHDPENNSWYYRWEYEETWEYNVPVASTLIVQDGQIQLRPFPTPTHCWKYGNSASLLIGSSAKLQQDIISRKPITFIPMADRKLSSRYSILVKQYVLTKEAFEYYQKMEKFSEELGSFFDPQPAEIIGNIRSLDSPNEPVIGFFSVGSEERKRIFIDKDEVPSWGFRQSCGVVELAPGERPTNSMVPVFTGERGALYVAPYECVDCSLWASTVKPDYWD